MSEVSLLEVAGLGKRFPSRDGRSDARWVIQNLSFSVRDGEFVTVIGPSGSGKSTLLNMIAQTDAPSAGTISFKGAPVSNGDGAGLRPGLDCQIGYVFQDDTLLPWRTTIDNVLFPLEAQGRLDAHGRERAAALMDAVGLTGFERYYPHELSGGMRKRAALIRTLVYDPPIILMDEPFGALDAQTRVQLQEDLLRLWEAGRKTIIFITHDIAEAIALGDRALVLSRAPTHIIGEHHIDIPRPRNLRDIYAAPQFASLYEAIRAQVQ
ncbi:MAG: ABC transporter ATP-binding protein [Ferrovibrio sp.]|uniref:ABC transporter ATP-binding protein n=1 Tax=Ferrovibrio sp. TaxID=1917215 RepID=UPI002628598F|nr:ABC transporter ATP-binding protein [Ferrovibrio sp.]MCW0236700.1 ABC transporter ATP-binding protein [Ferrovibrio sp.]